MLKLSISLKIRKSCQRVTFYIQLFWVLVSILCFAGPALANAQALSSQQIQAVSAFFRPSDILVPELSSYVQGTVSLGWDQKHQEAVLTLGYGRQEKMASGKKMGLHFEIEHHSIDQGIREPFKCRQQEYRQDINNSRFGKFITCQRLSSTPGLISATIYSLFGSGASHVRIHYMGTIQEIPLLIQSVHTLEYK